MFDRIINILIIEEDVIALSALRAILHSPGNNIFHATDSESALQLLEDKNFVLIFCSLELSNFYARAFLRHINAKNATKNASVIIMSNEQGKMNKLVGKHGVTDYLLKPYVPSLVKAKIGVYKKLYFKHQRVSDLLESILPAQTLSEYSLYGKSSPKKSSNCSVLFTDFVNFTLKTKNSDPHIIVKQLDSYFTQFDKIIIKYKLEKIKTIGDAYMAVAGVTENDPHPHIRTALAALEIRNFMQTDIVKKKAANEDFWETRLGIHTGDLVAGVVGKHKFSFDVWGDTVNIAARCEQNSIPNHINISSDFFAKIENYFDCTGRGKIAIKNRGEIGMYFLDQLKLNYSLKNEGKSPSIELRKTIGLTAADFKGLRNFVKQKLKTELSPNLYYHSWEHTKTVEEAVKKYGELENLSKHQLFLTRTAALLHDSGFLFRYNDNETLAVDFLKKIAPEFGYDPFDIQKIEKIILATTLNVVPTNLMEYILCDADLDYLGRVDYHAIAKKLFEEKEEYNEVYTLKERIERQIDYLENKHQYYTTSAKNLRAPGKLKRIDELKQQLLELTA